MVSFIKKWFFKPACALCNKKAESPLKYYNDQGQPVVVCQKCSDYAERRAFQKRK